MACILLVFWIFLSSVDSKANKPDTPQPPAPPSLTISFERQNIRQNDCSSVELLLVNNSEEELKTTLTIAGPSFITWSSEPCKKDSGESAGQSLDLGAISARSTLRRRLFLRTASTIEVGDYNSLFTVEYRWERNNVTASAFVSAEKPIKISFLGSESVGGIPLALAGFIVPGLVFWWIIKLFGAPWSLEGLSNQMIYSVFVSIVLMFIGTWLHISDISRGISMEKLLILSAAGLVAGVAVGGGDLLVRKEKARRAAGVAAAKLEQQIRLEESEASLLGKLLELPDKAQLNKPLILLKNGKRYIGALGALTFFAKQGSAESERIYSLVGSFVINAKLADETVKARLVELRASKKMRALVTLAAEKGLLNSIEEIQTINADGEFEPSGVTFMQWKEAEVASAAVDQENWEAPPLK
ncbi:MAG TPA: hypothetical protein VFX97_15895 [Pyrinomonadaceae bacterium]|nr:hypothetical protein [Pyrinomonadaceae bacterium]